MSFERVRGIEPLSPAWKAGVIAFIRHPLKVIDVYYGFMKQVSQESAIRSVVAAAVLSYSEGFEARHLADIENPSGTINMKIHNVFIAQLGKDVQYYAALVRSLDSSLGNMLEKMAVSIAKLNYEVKREVNGPLSTSQTNFIGVLLEQYKRHQKKPLTTDYVDLRKKPSDKEEVYKRHDSDYYLVDRETNKSYLVELKIGGDLDTKKARSEKEALLEQLTILSNVSQEDSDISIKFATAYNRFGEGKPWKQSRVLQFFSEDELLIGKNFWNFVCRLDNGYEIVLDEYQKNAKIIKQALDNIKALYLKTG